MDAALRLLLTNAAAAAALAALALVVSRVARRPAVAHALWLLALVRLVAPPLVPLSLLPGPTSATSAWPQTASLVAFPAGATRVGTSANPETAPLPAAAAGRLLPAAALPTPRGRLAHAAMTAVASGALLVLALAGVRFRRFRRLLEAAEPAPPAIDVCAAAIARRLGLRRVPRVLVVPARISPMLWPDAGGPTVLPRGLLGRLRGAERDALLAHELAHVRRRDHWVRLVELLATSLFWWYPVAWWCRAALRRAEERCCDEWVLRLLPRSAPAYASGLLKALTFVSAGPATQPALASGASPVHELETRLKEILMSRPAPRFARPARLALVAAAVLTLAVFPTHAREETPRPARAAIPTGAAAAPTPATPPQAVSAPAALPGAATPAAAPAEAATPATPGTRAPAHERRPPRPASEDDGRALEAKIRALQQEELALQREQLELAARAEQAELRASAEQLRAEGKARQAEALERQAELQAKRTKLQRRQLELDAARFELEAARRAAELASRDQVAAHERQRVAVEDAARELELRARELAARQHAQEATADALRSLAAQVETLRAALGEAGGRPEVEREIRRLQEAIQALEGGIVIPAPDARRTPRP